MITLEEVIEIARTAHAGQVDKQGRDYFEHHLVPVAKMLEHLGVHAVMAGYLHDIVEDHGDKWPLADLAKAGVPEPVLQAVDSVTRREGETYFDTIERACQDPLGVHVKIADNTLNILSNPGLAAIDPEKARSLLEDRYLPARDRLVHARATMPRYSGHVLNGWKCTCGWKAPLGKVAHREFDEHLRVVQPQ